MAGVNLLPVFEAFFFFQFYINFETTRSSTTVYFQSSSTFCVTGERVERRQKIAAAFLDGLMISLLILFDVLFDPWTSTKKSWVERNAQTKKEKKQRNIFKIKTTILSRVFDLEF